MVQVLSTAAASRSRGYRPWKAVEATAVLGGLVQQPPAPTPAAFRRKRNVRPELAAMRLLRRDDDLDSICGYEVSGSKTTKLSCDEGACVVDTDDGVFGCCDDTDDDDCADDFYTECWDSTDADGVTTDFGSQTLVCSDDTSSVCGVIVLQTDGEDEATSFGCATEYVTVTLQASLSSAASSASSSSSKAKSTTKSSSGLAWMDPTAVYSYTESTKTTATSSGGSTTSSHAAATSHAAAATGTIHLSAGAIGGIAAGCVAVFALVAFMLFRVFKSRRDANAEHMRSMSTGGFGGGGKGAATTSAMAVGAAGSAYQQDQQAQQDQMQQHLLAHDDTGAAGGNPVSQPVAAWGIPGQGQGGGGGEYYPMQDQRNTAYDGTGYGPRASYYDPQAAAAGAAVPSSQPPGYVTTQRGPVEM